MGWSETSSPARYCRPAVVLTPPAAVFQRQAVLIEQATEKGVLSKLRRPVLEEEINERPP
jgi:hypothetical protein